MEIDSTSSSYTVSYSSGTLGTKSVTSTSAEEKTDAALEDSAQLISSLGEKVDVKALLTNLLNADSLFYQSPGMSELDRIRGLTTYRKVTVFTPPVRGGGNGGGNGGGRPV